MEAMQQQEKQGIEQGKGGTATESGGGKQKQLYFEESSDDYLTADAESMFRLMHGRGDIELSYISEARSLWGRLEDRCTATTESLTHLRADIEERHGPLEPDTSADKEHGAAQDRLMSQVRRIAQQVLVDAKRYGIPEIDELEAHAKRKAIALGERRGDGAGCRARVEAKCAYDTTGVFHPHRIEMAHSTPQRWMCDGCEAAYDGDIGRYRCRQGCDYDLCRECFTLAFMWVYEEAEKEAYESTRGRAFAAERRGDHAAIPEWVVHRMRKPSQGERGPPPGCWTLWHGHQKVPVSL